MIPSYKSGRALVALVAVAGMTTFAACGSDSSDSASSGGSSSGGSCANVNIAFVGALTGDSANLGINIADGANTALAAYNKAHPDCKVTMKKFDSQGDPEKATPLATQIINDKSVVGVVGPGFSGESAATGPAFSEAGLVTVSASATNADLTKNGWKTFHRVLGSDAAQGPAAATYIKNTLKAKKVFVVDDATDYGKPLAASVKSALGPLVVGTDRVQLKQTDFGPTVTKAKASGADTLYYGGYYAEAGLLLKQLRAAGYKGYFVSDDGAKDAGLVEAAGKSAANGAIVTCPCGEASADFAKEFEAANPGSKPGTYSGEGFDAAQILLDGIADGKTTRSDLLAYVNAYDKDGLTKKLKFTPTGEISDPVIYAFKVDSAGDIKLDTAIK